MKTFAERLAWARTQRGYSRAGLDELANLSAGHTAKLERGGRDEPSATTVGKLAEALDVDMKWLAMGGAKRPSLGAA